MLAPKNGATTKADSTVVDDKQKMMVAEATRSIMVTDRGDVGRLLPPSEAMAMVRTSNVEENENTSLQGPDGRGLPINLCPTDARQTKTPNDPKS